MRILLLGAATIALSGCSWLGGPSYHGTQAPNGTYYSYGQQGCCAGNQKLSRWNVEGGVGPAFFVGGDVFTPEDTHELPGVTANSLSMENAYDPGMRYELGGSYALNPNRKVTLMGSYSQADGEPVDVGTIAGNTVSGDLSDFESYGVEAGLRQYFAPAPMPVVKSVRPYVEGRLGATYVDDIRVENATLSGVGPYNGGTIGLYESGWVPSAAALVGVEAPVFDRMTLGLETGIRYTAQLESDTSSLNGAAPFSGINNGGDTLTVPVMLRGRYRF